MSVNITDHAVARYLERALDVDVEGFRALLGGRHVADRVVLEHLRHQHFFDVDGVRASLYRHVHKAAEAGAATLFDGCFTFILDGRRLVTVYAGRPRNEKGLPHRGFRNPIEALA